MPTRSARFLSKRDSCCARMSSTLVCATSANRAATSKSFSGSLVWMCSRIRAAPPAITIESPSRATSRRRPSRSIASPSSRTSVQNRNRMSSGVLSKTAARMSSGAVISGALRADSRKYVTMPSSR